MSEVTGEPRNAICTFAVDDPMAGWLCLAFSLKQEGSGVSHALAIDSVTDLSSLYKTSIAPETQSARGIDSNEFQQYFLYR
jgi:hypothetical protein